MGPLPSFNTSRRASVLGRPLTFGNYFPTKWLPARPMKSYSSPLTIKPARSASRSAFPSNKHYATVDRNPTYRILLSSASDEPSDTPLSPLQSFRQAMHQALYVHDRQRIPSLSTIKYIFKSYTALLGQGTLEPVDTLAISRLLRLTMDCQPPGIQTAILRYIDVFAGHYVTKVLPPHSEASRDLMSLYRNIGKHENARRLWDWIVHQDNRYVSIKTYAEAIELAAASNQSLRICEELYDEALMRYTDKLTVLYSHPDSCFHPDFVTGNQ